jgi:hypothetical protein
MTRAWRPVALVGFVLAALTFPTAGAAETAAEATAGRDEATTVPSPGDLLTWRHDEGTWARLSGVIALDMRAFPRVEAGHGPSWHVEPFLSTARATGRFCWRNLLAARLDVELAETNPDLQEAWFEFRKWDLFRVRAGRFRVPFGLTPQIEVQHLRLLSVPMMFGNSKDFRDVGLLVFGDWHDGWLGYAVSVGSGSRDIRVDVNDRPDVVARLVLHPPRGRSWWWSGLQVGVSGAWGEGPERQGFRGRTMGGHSFYSPPTVRGTQWRLAADLEYATPWFRVAGEYLWSRQERTGLTAWQMVGGSGIDVGDLAPLVTRGWYVEGSGLLFGRKSPDFVPVSGLEVCARFETVSFGDGRRVVTTPAGDEDRAPLVDANVMGVTAGINGYVQPGIRLGLFWQGLRFDDGTMAPDHEGTGTGAEWFHQVFLRAQWSI